MTVLPAHPASRRRPASIGTPWPIGSIDQPAHQPVCPVLIARGAELAQLVAAVTQPPAVAVVEGEAGVGKTRLIRELREHPDTVGRQILVGGCRTIREPFPLGPVLDAVGGLRRWLRPEVFSPVAGALRPLLPELADLLPGAPEPLDNTIAERHRLFRGLIEVLSAVSPVTLVLEDLHWADAQTMDFLRYVIADPPADLSVVVTFRREEASAQVRAVASRISDQVTRHAVVLAPMDAHATGALAAAIVGTDAVADDFASHLCQRTGGLPFAIEQVMALLRERGLVTRDGQQWSRRLLDGLGVPAALRDHVQERAGLLSAPARSMLAVLAVLEQPASETVVAAVSSHSDAQVAAGLSEAIACGLLVDIGDVVGFRHTLAAQAIYAGVAGPMRRQLHDRAATVLSELPVRPLGQIAHHLQRAGRIAEWMVVAEAAADQAVGLGNFDEAVGLLEEILRQGVSDAATVGRLALKLGWAGTETLHACQVDEVVAQALEQPLDRQTRGELEYLRAVLLDQVGGEPELVRTLLRRSVADLAGLPELQARALAAKALRSSPKESLARRKRWLERVVGLLPAVASPPAEMFLLGKVASALVFMGYHEWRDVTERIRAGTAGLPSTRHEGNAWYSAGSAACFVGHHEAAGELLAGALTGAVATQNNRLEAFIRSAIAAWDFSRGAWDNLPQPISDLHEQLGTYPGCRQLAQMLAASLALARGGGDHSAGQLEALVQRRVPGSYTTTVAAAMLLRWQLARADWAGALATAQTFLDDHGPRVALQPVFFRALPWLIEALLSADRADEARALLIRCSRELRRTDAPLAPAALRHSRGLLALAGSDPVAAAHHLELAGQRYERLPSPYEAALAREQQARALLVAGDTAGLAQPLRWAVDTFERLGATWDLGRATRFARMQKVPLPTRQRSGIMAGSELSPREREVAELAATGYTNKEIAGQLSVSAETVKKHLQAVMRKLDVPTRAAIARELGGQMELAPVR